MNGLIRTLTTGVLAVAVAGAGLSNVIVARDLLIAADTGKTWHIAHVSTATSLDLIRWARARGVRVTCEVTPHHLVFLDEDPPTFVKDMESRQADWKSAGRLPDHFPCRRSRTAAEPSVHRRRSEPDCLAHMGFRKPWCRAPPPDGVERLPRPP